MDGNEQVCVVLVGYLGTTIELHEPVILEGVNDFYRRLVALYEVSQSFCAREGNVFLVSPAVDRSGILSAVSGIDNDSFQLYNLFVLSM